VKFRLLLLCLLLNYSGLLAQGKLRIYDCQSQALLLEQAVLDSVDRNERLADLLAAQQQQGYLSAYIQVVEQDSLRFCLEKGVKFTWFSLRLHPNITGDWLRTLGYKSRYFDNQPVNPAQLDQLCAGLLRLAENEGFPFARLYFDSLQIVGQQISVGLRLERGPEVRYAGIRLAGDASLRERFLRNYLQLNTGALYSQKNIDQISRRLSALPYLTESEAARIYFINDQAEIYLYTQKQRANNFDGMLGVFPNSANNKLLLTGDINLQLWSVFKQGEQLGFNFRSLQPGTQDLKIKLSWPFLFQTPLGVDADFSLFKRDSTFLEIQSKLGLQYVLNGADWLRAYLENRSYDLLTSTRLPGFANVGGNLFGLEYQRFRLDRALNPSRGFRYLIGGGAGEREVAAFEDVAAKRLPQYQLKAEGEAYWPWLPRWIAAFELNSRFLITNQLYQNELYRLGGFKTLKGFDEMSVNASQYAFLNIEQRFLLDRGSWLYAFWNGGWLRNGAIGQDYTDTPYGFGAGLTFTNKAGIFSLVYALGSEQSNSLRLNAAKVHLGYRYLL